jgi:molybdopterin converting factor small subunit
MAVTVKVLYCGKFSVQAGLAEEEFEVNENMHEAYSSIVSYITERYNFHPPFTVIINGVHIMRALKNGTSVETGDEFLLLPVHSGG